MVAPYADKVWVYALSMDGEGDRNWQNVREVLDHHFPGLTERYRQIVFSADHPYWTGLRRKLQGIQREGLLDLR